MKHYREYFITETLILAPGEEWILQEIADEIEAVDNQKPVVTQIDEFTEDGVQYTVWDIYYAEIEDAEVCPGCVYERAKLEREFMEIVGGEGA